MRKTSLALLIAATLATPIAVSAPRIGRLTVWNFLLVCQQHYDRSKCDRWLTEALNPKGKRHVVSQ